MKKQNSHVVARALLILARYLRRTPVQVTNLKLRGGYVLLLLLDDYNWLRWPTLFYKANHQIREFTR
jgi:hypothetical protein